MCYYVSTFSTKDMDDNLRNLIALQQLQTTQQLVKQTAPPTGPKCPYCGGYPEPNYERCKNCASTLSWVQGRPCKPGEEGRTLMAIEADKKEYKQQKEREQKEKQENEIIQLWISIVVGAIVALVFGFSGDWGRGICIGALTALIMFLLMLFSE
jgi:hypothetical protein